MNFFNNKKFKLEPNHYLYTYVMKKLLYILVVLCSVGTLSQAQSSKDASSIITEAKEIAQEDGSIQVWECKKSGKITFVKEITDNGKTQFKQVFYNSVDKVFVDNLNTQMSCSKNSEKKENCSSSEKKACCSNKKEQSSVQVNTQSTQKPSCSQGSSKSCCASNKGKMAKTQ